MLGAVTVEGAEFSVRASRYVELVALILALGGKITIGQINEYMYNGESTDKAVRHVLARTRKALGTTADGKPRLSHETATKQYELHDVSSDYQQILDVCEQITTDSSMSRDEACALMDSAAQLIEGPPYAAAGTSYDWIYTAGEANMARRSADKLCRELGNVYLALGNYNRARWSIRQGLRACSPCDALYESLIAVTAKDGTRSDLTALWHEITAAYEAADMEIPHELAASYGVALTA